MGYAKSLIDNDFYELNSNACTKCIGDIALIERLNTSEAIICDYCNSESSTTYDTADLPEIIFAALSEEYEDPVHQCPYDEGEYIAPELLDTTDLIEREFGIDHGDLVQKISENIPTEKWCEIDPFRLKTNEALGSVWNNFKELIKHESRYFFMNARRDVKYDDDEIDVINTLNALENIIKELKLYKTLDVTDKIYRARILKENENINSASLGSPPKEWCNVPNRMSPRGISMFYGSFDKETALKEIKADKKEKNERIICGTWKPIRPLNLIDLSIFIHIPSICDIKNRQKRPFIKFLQNFIKDISLPTSPNYEDIDYIPTQVITEYLRNIFKFPNGIKVDGLLYNSSYKNRGQNIVIFADNKNCIYIEQNPNQQILDLEKYEE